VKGGAETIIVPELEAIAESYDPRAKRWTKEEERVLEAYYRRVPPEAIADHLGRSIGSVRNKAQDMGLMGFCRRVAEE